MRHHLKQQSSSLRDVVLGELSTVVVPPREDHEETVMVSILPPSSRSSGSSTSSISTAGAQELRVAREHLSDGDSDEIIMDLSARFADEVVVTTPHPPTITRWRKRGRGSGSSGGGLTITCGGISSSSGSTKRACRKSPRMQEIARQIARAKKARELRRLALQRGSRQACIDR